MVTVSPRSHVNDPNCTDDGLFIILLLFYRYIIVYAHRASRFGIDRFYAK